MWFPLCRPDRVWGILTSGSRVQKGRPWHSEGMPIAVAAFLTYALLLLAGLGLTLGPIVEQATAAPVTLQGVVWMALIAACIFTITLVWQRKEAGRGFALGLSTILIPAGPLIALTLGNWLPGLPPIALALLLIRGLRGGAARAWLNEQ